ncbi:MULTISPECIES: DUF3077 domain-containing protein [Pseudomonas]|uniref:DUF3077 domain-containing protein n=1 Tax=Pseudomonas TaxID=286 RepID=UPI0008192215|nr:MULTISPECIES: DUF3077 domain-containing protein [Pseudomonas]KAB5624523.1 DUF3077 domain-containing protein [Pseudomonas putida]MBK0058782.1 DUF3077 domain-containing protein [Pseudomonas sp. S44]OCT32875.1 hypothetical protein A6E20_24585 [Pseudomonas putida]OCT33121.1 hypothetical protein A6E23_24535 [Pseudomonas putida]OCT34884.1 hypothetical protein A6E24_24505 [Pseudomonas putida]
MNENTTPGIATALGMFRVQPGIPVDQAFDEVSLLLGCVRDLSQGSDEDIAPAALTALRYLSAMAKALLNDLEVARNQQV